MPIRCQKVCHHACATTNAVEYYALAYNKMPNRVACVYSLTDISFHPVLSFSQTCAATGGRGDFSQNQYGVQRRSRRRQPNLTKSFEKIPRLKSAWSIWALIVILGTCFSLNFLPRACRFYSHEVRWCPSVPAGPLHEIWGKYIH